MLENTEDAKRKSCFIITPIGNLGSDTYRKMDGVIQSVIRPMLIKYGFSDVKAAHEISKPGSITTQIIERIVYDDLVIANLTGNNPNVMYELCLRHVVAKPLIHICEFGTDLPFDLKDNRTIFFTDDLLGAKELKDNIEAMLEEIKYEEEYMDNPIYTAIKKSMLLKTPKNREEKIEVMLLQEILNKVSGGFTPVLFEIEDKCDSDMLVKLKRIIADKGEINIGNGKVCIRLIDSKYDEYIKNKLINENIRFHVNFYAPF